MSKFIQTHFFYPFTFLLPTKQREEKLKYLLSSYFAILPPFSILPLFHISNQTNPKKQNLIKTQTLNLDSCLNHCFLDWVGGCFWYATWYAFQYSVSYHVFGFISKDNNNNILEMYSQFLPLISLLLDLCNYECSTKNGNTIEPSKMFWN